MITTLERLNDIMERTASLLNDTMDADERAIVGSTLRAHLFLAFHKIDAKAVELKWNTVGTTITGNYVPPIPGADDVAGVKNIDGVTTFSTKSRMLNALLADVQKGELITIAYLGNVGNTSAKMFAIRRDDLEARR